MWFSTHLATVSVSTRKSPTGSLTGQWYLYYFLFSGSILSKFAWFSVITFSLSALLPVPVLPTLATWDSLLTLAIPYLAPSPFFLLFIFYLKMWCHSNSIFRVREALIMCHLKWTFTVKSFLIPIVRIKICPLCWPNRFLCSQFYWEAICKSWCLPASLEVMLLDWKLLFFFFSLSPNNVDFIKC